MLNLATILIFYKEKYKIIQKQSFCVISFVCLCIWRTWFHLRLDLSLFDMFNDFCNFTILYHPFFFFFPIYIYLYIFPVREKNRTWCYCHGPQVDWWKSWNSCLTASKIPEEALETVSSLNGVTIQGTSYHCWKELVVNPFLSFFFFFFGTKC